MNYNEDPKTIDLYPAQVFLEDLTPDDIAEGIEEKSTAIYEATKGKNQSMLFSFVLNQNDIFCRSFNYG